ncbi:MAG: 1-(5-phosphoribosyl)-5-[(5-phosphoribosylamino)methylideneamino]imidazole-4-carboxamide isomerase [Chloroflexi bacterium]|nr:1-(5-phosphoribosyl)-5-[(5-phosphoribosylamino)methylideneamino]imidazole-4-carboxamide isomerase [Chloroflexota bacterium]
MFEVIPAIDLQGGRCVRLVQGDFDRSTTYGDDPPAMARRWEASEARRIHVVDLDGAQAGAPLQLGVVKRIVEAVRVPVQLGGGLRTLADLEAAFAVGVARAILGTAALDDPSLLDVALARFGERIVVGIDARDGQVAVRGWQDVSGTDALDFARSVARRGARAIVYTDIARDGMLSGPNHSAMRRMAAAVPGVDVIASGGVGRLDDVLSLLDTGVRGVIVGKAIYTGALDLAEAVRRVDAADTAAGG